MEPEDALRKSLSTLPNREQIDWPFDQPKNCATITLRNIIAGDAPILHVSHDADDHGWQFLDGNDVEPSDAAVVLLSEVVDHDPTVLSLADLPPGWIAWRESFDSEWQRAPHLRISG